LTMMQARPLSALAQARNAGRSARKAVASKAPARSLHTGGGVRCNVGGVHQRRSFGLGGLISSIGLIGGMSGEAMMRPGVAYAAKASAIAEVLETAEFPDTWPYTQFDLARYDETDDAGFYTDPRFVTHIDDEAIKSLTKYYETALPPSGTEDAAVLDICSSWISHYPKGYSAGKIVGLGMNAEELARNPVLSSYDVVDLNKDPKLPYDDNSFDVVTNAVSVDYLTKPKEVFAEMQRVLKPGGRAIMSFSNRCFPTKVISIWSSTGDADHVWIVGSYFHYTEGFGKPQSEEITNPKLRGKVDPMYVVTAVKEA